ncbi:MAG TPA: MXAN_5187 C-terminal domain-containing protein [Candidatus Angelobacter sp.]|nr:MXAN_5187 C-terminal domain-containing protein [Candidatus Angelobacter sp.]
MTIDEELSLLEDQIRRLKVEYDIYFGGGSKKPPTEIEWKVKNLLKKYSDGSRMNYGQRFRFTTVQQKYALYNALWQQKLIIKEEGYRRPQDAMLGIQGMRSDQQHEAERSLNSQNVSSAASSSDSGAGTPFRVAFADAKPEAKSIESLYNALVAARQQTGEKSSATLDSFKKFVQQKTTQLKKEHGCQAVEYSVEMQNGQVKLKAKPKT